MKRYVRFTVLLLVLFSLISCISLESELEVRNDGSGSLRLSYRISRMVAQLGHIDGGNTIIPLPVQEEDFRDIAEKNEGLVLKNFKTSSDAEYISIEAEIEFTNPEALSVLLGGTEGENISFEQEQGRFSLTQRLYEGLGEPISDDALLMLETYFGSDTITCTVRTETTIRESSLGSIGADGKHTRYHVSLGELVRSPEPVIFTVTW